jgi:hypothetical protein
MSDQHDWEFAGPDDAKAEIRAARARSQTAILRQKSRVRTPLRSHWARRAGRRGRMA